MTITPVRNTSRTRAALKLNLKKLITTGVLAGKKARAKEVLVPAKIVFSYNLAGESINKVRFAIFFKIKVGIN